ncbi:MAG: 50S ribosomal protein L17 [bacterium]|nr:50S ribosomal protein L17 [Candidatus Kapabacteria bacterium]
MRHRVQGRKLKRTHSHRIAMFRGLATQLFRYKRIKTTEAKAKEMRRFAEAIITRAKRAYLAEQGGAPVSVHARRIVARDVNDPAVVQELFSEIVQKVANRPGGYTRVVKLRQRLGDGARLAVLELVDWNMDQDESAVRGRAKSTMSRSERVARSKAKAAKSAPEAPAAKAKAKATAADASAVASADATAVAVAPAPDADVTPDVDITPTADATSAPVDETTPDDAPENT